MKIDTAKIENYAEMSAEDKIKALEEYEFEAPAPKELEEVTKLKTALSKETAMQPSGRDSSGKSRPRPNEPRLNARNANRRSRKNCGCSVGIRPLRDMSIHVLLLAMTKNSHNGRQPQWLTTMPPK